MLSSTLDIVGDVISYLVWFVNGLLDAAAYGKATEG